MSGLISIPFAFLALLSKDADTKIYFNIVAFLGMWGVVASLIRKNHQIAKENNKTTSDLQYQIKTLENAVQSAKETKHLEESKIIDNLVRFRG